jgi:Cu2+-containing amine oxidase
LDPLTPHEILQTRQILSKSLNPVRFSQLRFNIINLKEPPKAQLLPYFLKNTNPPRNLFPRKSFSVLVEDNGSGVLYEAIVNLDQGKFVIIFLKLLSNLPRTCHQMTHDKLSTLYT